MHKRKKGEWRQWARIPAIPSDIKCDPPLQRSDVAPI